ncbi:MAG: protoheme IX farnesyltransferase [Planctomycetota bacterium]|nr:MAG: protoheme IX farnesyltransferase [Planctomycetota bacterium]
MSMPSLAIERPATVTSRVLDYVELTKPKISALVLVTVAVATFVAAWGPPDGWTLFHTLLGTALVAASASALNQWLERDTDARMQRTAARPLPAARLTVSQVIGFAVVSIVVGTVYLAATVGWLTAALGMLTWALYAWIYTPLKRRTAANTAVGAVAGAMPVLLGWSATGAPFDLRAWSLFLIVFLWQFPHFMAIAWIYRNEYAGAGLKMLSTVDPSGFRAGAQAVTAALALVPVSLVPCLSQPAGGVLLAWALVLGVAQLACAVLFFVQLNERSARRLLLASLLYLPIMMGLLALGPLA